MKLLIKNGIVVNHDEEPAKRDIFIEHGVITRVEENIDEDIVETIDAEGLYVLPGLIDMHCKIGEPGYEHQEDTNSASKSAAKGGFTSITCLPGTRPVIDNITVVDYINTKSKVIARVNVFLYGSATKGGEGKELAEIGEMIKAGVVAVSDGGSSIEDAGLMRKILMYSGMFNIPVITACEDGTIAGGGVMNSGLTSTQIGLMGVPREAEETIVARNILLARYNKSRLHISHVTTRGSVFIVKEAKKFGVPVTCGACPHYFTLTEESVESYNTLAKVKPPLRTADDVDAVREGVAEGVIDVITSGHTPTTIESKQTEFDRAEYGISSLETAFCVSFTELVRKKIITLPQLVNRMSKKPADILGLDTKGEIKPGMDADMMMFSDKNRFTVKAREFASKAKFSPYDGRQMYGDVAFTIVNGKVVYLK